MKLSRIALRVYCAVVTAAVSFYSSVALAVGPLDLPTASGIAPGDLIIDDFFNGWLKLDPTTNELFSLPWSRTTTITPKFAFDRDGAILQFAPGRADASIARLHPVSGKATYFGPTTLPFPSDFDIATNGDLIIARQASHSTKTGDIWSGTGDGWLYRYVRQTGEVLRLRKPTHFSPSSVAIGQSDLTYIGEFFRGVVQVDLQNGNLTQMAVPELATNGVYDFFPNGDLAINNGVDGVHRLNPVTGEDTNLMNGLTPYFIRDVAINSEGNVWLAHSNGLYLIDGVTGVRTLVASQTFFAPRALAVVPADWTPPPVPEPSSLAILVVAIPSCFRWRRTSGGSYSRHG